MKLDTQSICRHTQTTVPSTTRVIELATPLSAQLAAVVFTIVTVILILPR